MTQVEGKWVQQKSIIMKLESTQSASTKAPQSLDFSLNM